MAQHTTLQLIDMRSGGLYDLNPKRKAALQRISSGTFAPQFKWTKVGPTNYVVYSQLKMSDVVIALLVSDPDMPWFT